MSLRVWLPLNGDLTNNGLSDYTLSAARGTISYDNSGKIGKCFQATGTNAIKIANIIPDFYKYNSYSFSAWVCITAQNTSHVGSAIISAGNWNSQLLNLAVSNFETDHYTRLLVSGSNWTVYYAHNFYLNTWYHIVITCDGGKTRAYVDNTLIGDTLPGFLPTAIQGDDIYIGGATYTSIMQFYGKINDVRIYDHALSPKEVKLLSQGLVCHYKLSDPYIESTTNIINIQHFSAGTSTWGGHTSVRTNEIVSNPLLPSDVCTKIDITYSGSGGGGCGLAVGSNIAALPSTTYTYSAYIKASNDFTTRSIANILYRIENNASGSRVKEGGVFDKTRTISMGDGWYRCWGTFTTQSTTANMSVHFYIYPDMDATYYICCWQLEQKDHMTPYVLGTRNENIVYDSSGYNRHGVNYSSQVLPNAPRNANATFFDGSSQYIEFPNLSFMPTMLPDEWSFSFWVYNQDNGDRSIIFSNYQLGTAGINGFCFEKAANNNLRVGYVGGKFDRTIPNSTMTVDAWTHYVVTKTKAHLVTVYRNGIQIDSYTNTNCASEGVIYRMGRDVRSDSTMYHGGLADFRAYATVLTLEDAQELYNAPVSVANTGAVLTQGEFVEVAT